MPWPCMHAAQDPWRPSSAAGNRRGSSRRAQQLCAGRVGAAEPPGPAEWAHGFPKALSHVQRHHRHLGTHAWRHRRGPAPVHRLDAQRRWRDLRAALQVPSHPPPVPWRVSAAAALARCANGGPRNGKARLAQWWPYTQLPCSHDSPSLSSTTAVCLNLRAQQL